MSSEMTSFMTQQGLSCSIVQKQRDASVSYIDFEMSLFGNGVKRADVEFLYRTVAGNPWLSDAVIMADNAHHSHDNIMYGIPCSRLGTKNLIRWDISENNLSIGDWCEINIVLKPDPLTFSYYNGRTFVESLLGSGHAVVEGKYERKIVGCTSNGGLMGLTDSSFYLIDTNGDKIMEYGGLNLPSFAQEKDDGNYLVLDDSLAGPAAYILEIDPEGTLVKQVATPESSWGMGWLHYDNLTGNVLVSGDNTNGGYLPKVYEVVWDARTPGVVRWFWEYNPPGRAGGVSYLSDDRDVILIADTGNNRVVVVDRTPSGDVESYIENVTFGSTSVPVNNLLAVLSSKGLVQILEGVGETENFNTTMSSHPALARALGLGSGTKNGLEWYDNLVFGPVIRGVD